ncbi:MAG: methyltransferase [Pseudomonadota bacterium]
MLAKFLFPAAAIMLAACATTDGGTASKSAAFDGARLDVVLAAQKGEDQARYQWRHPKETLEFFGVAPGMTVVDTLPGEVWYSGILANYLGADGEVIGADYSPEMWKLFGAFADEEFLAQKATWAADWVQGSAKWAPADGAKIGGVAYGSIPEEMKGTVDIVLMVRAFHHFNRFEEEGGFRTAALADAMSMLKPGGIVGVVQHRAPEANSDKWAEGDNGYVKQSEIVKAFEAAGFEFVGSSEINANPADKPTETDIVWRLPPSLGTSRKDPALKAQMEAIGESDRMTLKFRKPG